MATLKVDVQPSVLIWARESIGLTREEAAAILRTDPLSLRFIEEGAEEPTYSMLERMARIYDRPLIAFFLPEPPRDAPEDALPDFRIDQQAHGSRWSRKLHQAYRRVRRQREIAAALAPEQYRADIGNLPPFDKNSSPVAVGHLLRTWLGAPTVNQVSRLTSGEVLREWISLVENKDILVTHVPGIPVEEMRGFSIKTRPFPIIALNGRDSPRGRVFTLIHELVHVLLDDSALCDLEQTPYRPRTSHEQTERFCNSVAAETLMPRDVLLKEGILTRVPTPRAWSDQELNHLAQRFGVSEESMLLQLVTLNMASWDFYFERRKYYRDAYKRRMDTENEREGGPSYSKMKLRDLGRRYITTVLNAYYDDRISASDLAGYLDIKLNNLPNLINELENAA